MPQSFTRSLMAAAAICSPVFCLSAQQAQPSPQAATQAASQIAEMQQVEDAWDAAVAKHDQFALENLLSPDYIGISAAGDVTTRNQQISHIFVAGAEPLSIRQTVIAARVMGDVAVVNGTYVMEWPGTGKEQDKIAEKGVFTQVFRKNSAGNWQCLNSQRTVVATDEERKQRAAKAKHKSSSSAELPFHVPLIYNGPTGNPSAEPSTPKPQQ